MSDEFTRILNLGVYVRPCTYGLFAAWFVVFVLNQKMRVLPWKTGNQLGLIAILAMVTSQCLFEFWWNALGAARSTEADKIWVANHDGGGLIIVFLGNAIKTGVLIGLCSAYASLQRKKEAVAKMLRPT